MLTRALITAIALTAGASAADACMYDGIRGYLAPSGNACRAAYRFQAYGRGKSIDFVSDGRSWTFALRGSGDDLWYDLTAMSPPTRSSMTGQMSAAPGDPVIRGRLTSGFCGDGYIRLTPVPGTCGRSAAPVYPPVVPVGYDPATQGGSFPVSGHSYGGNVRASPSVNARRIAGLKNGTPITVLEDTGVAMDGFNWFRISWAHGKGYQWGGILCGETEATGLYVCRN